MAEIETRPAFYAVRPGGWRDWWTILHPPYTAWHLSYVVLGATLAPETDGVRLVATLLAFFLAVGVSAHAFDELHGRPLRTRISERALKAVGGAALVGAVALGCAGLSSLGPGVLVFIAMGPALVVGYTLELWGGRLHTGVGFAAAWGAFPVLTAYYAQAERLDVAAVMGAVAAFALSYAQRSLSTPARMLRRKVQHVEGALGMADGSVLPLDTGVLLQPLERALKALSWSMVALAGALAIARLA